MKLKNYIIVGLGILLGLSLLKAKISTAKLSNDLADANNYITQQGELIEVAEGQYEQILLEARSSHQLSRTLKNDNEALFNRNKTLNRQITNLTTIIAGYDTIDVSGDIAIVTNKDSILVNVAQSWGSVGLRAGFLVNPARLDVETSLNYYEGGIKINYWLSTIEGIFKLNVMRDPIPIHYTLSQDSSGNWIADVKLPDYMSVSEISGQVVPYRVKWYNKIKVGVGFDTTPSLLTTIGYGHWLVGKRFETQGNTWFVLRTTPIFKLHK